MVKDLLKVFLSLLFTAGLWVKKSESVIIVHQEYMYGEKLEKLKEYNYVC